MDLDNWQESVIDEKNDNDKCGTHEKGPLRAGNENWVIGTIY